MRWRRGGITHDFSNRVWFEAYVDVRCWQVGFNWGSQWWPCFYVHLGPLIVGAFWKGRRAERAELWKDV